MWVYTCENRAAARENERVRCLLGYESKGLAFCGGIVRKRSLESFLICLQTRYRTGKYQTRLQLECVYFDAQNNCYPIITELYRPSSKKRNTCFRTYITLTLFNVINRMKSRDLNIKSYTKFTNMKELMALK